MKRTIIIILSCVSLSCCGVKESQEENLKTISDLEVRMHMKDSVIVMYQDSLKDCREDCHQLEHWLKRQ